MKLAKSLAVAALAGAGLLALGPAAAGAAPAASAPADPVGAGGQCDPAAFDTAAVKADRVAHTATLVVTGTKSATNVQIKLVPVVYVRQPDYWAIMVYGCSSGIGLPVLTPYTAVLDVTHTLGRIGIEVDGSNLHVRIPVRPVG